MNELIINVGEGEVQLAVLQDKQLFEFSREAVDSPYTVGDLFLARVARVMPNLNAAFLQVGYEKDAFLHYFDLSPHFLSLVKHLREVRSGKNKTGSLMYFKKEPEIPKDGKIGDYVKPGDLLLVKIAKEPISNKGPRLSCELSIAGRYLVLVPFGEKISVSTKIREFAERDRLRSIVEPHLPENFGAIIRTAAKGISSKELEADLQELKARWESCMKQVRTAEPPAKVLGELKRSSAILRDLMNDSFSFDAVHVNDKKLYEELREFVQKSMPGKESIIHLYTGRQNIFEHFGVSRQIKTSFGRHVPLKGGGYLVIEHTEALHVIDVNSGNMSFKDKDQEENALQANLEAAREIARQLRLRDMGGIIVVDFIDMYKAENKQKLYEALKEFMSTDRAKHNVLPPSKIGLVQITRERVRPVVSVDTLETCPSCNGTGRVESTLLIAEFIDAAVRKALQNPKVRRIILECHPYLHAYLTKGLLSQRIRWIWRFKKWVRIQPDHNLRLNEYVIKDQEGKILG
ncbi:MAG: Rne/Rng family ribonuclease [Flavobacteriales bacterium]|nr:Rne/Rng family ribonuclease [Flavobacteriales bacterium]MCX7768324.1 Rne/Rng family ribonuclease [Flavobacteriales bacterium]MDW8409952.1 Rne/Rng family ribonuclease [Flavobacteriales bacterium]